MWRDKEKDMGNPLHSICSYMAMFPPNMPNYFINRYSSPGDKVLDPFSGRGTTPLEACLEGRIGIGNDLNPLAYVLTKAKINVPYERAISFRIDELESLYRDWENLDNEIPQEINMIFNESTLYQLLFLRENLNWKKRNVDCFIIAMLLGIVHGNSPGYLSLRMPNTFSMSPNYVKNYIQKNGLMKPKRDAFELLRKKLERCYQRPEVRGKVYKCDARNLHYIKDNEIDLILTSPPYINVIRYGAFNWIRLWILNESPKDVDKKLLTTGSPTKYKDFMLEALYEFNRVTREGGRIVLILGDVRDRSNGKNYNLAELIAVECASKIGLFVEGVIVDNFNEDSKVSRIWGSKKGKATKTERALILRK